MWVHTKNRIVHYLSRTQTARFGAPKLQEAVNVAAAVRKISFSADSIITAFIQKGDVHGLLQI